jgi:hypothetical protein
VAEVARPRRCRDSQFGASEAGHAAPNRGHSQGLEITSDGSRLFARSGLSGFLAVIWQYDALAFGPEPFSCFCSALRGGFGSANNRSSPSRHSCHRGYGRNLPRCYRLNYRPPLGIAPVLRSPRPLAMDR